MIAEMRREPKTATGPNVRILMMMLVADTCVKWMYENFDWLRGDILSC